MIHLYAVVDGLGELPPVAGLGDAPLERLRVEDIDVVVSDAPASAPEESDEAVLRHALVVEELMPRSAAVLPGRLGQDFADEDALARAVHADADRLRSGLRRVRGCVELGLRVLRPERAAVPERPTGGAGYMRARLAEESELERLATEIHEPLARFASASVRGGGAARSVLLEAAYLVPLDAVERFREELARFESLRPELGFVCTGPWPPYSFAAENGERA
ncbi:MAG TPA: GvpL/GvpF family gas vesicle protein [Gaiellaceae bacterium]|nr:GvpL/GvpF family gas vesicle protein [Gaiellaceae bacterium]